MSAKGARRADALSALEDRIGWRFKNRALLEEAMRHGSVLGERKNLHSNERLEFLGDRVLNLTIARRLFEAMPEADQGALARRFNRLVDRNACARAARRADLGAAVTLSKSEEIGGGRDRDSLLADACEAIIAALYLDGGMAPAEDFIHRFWAEDLGSGQRGGRDAKSALQEYAASQHKGLRYHVVERSGPEHSPVFIVEALLDDANPVQGKGGSKREAEQAAAAALLKKLKVNV
ncbi:MAG: ribonuclease III [Hyphomonadaceae bacterium]